jgi:hypothetical protein
VHPAASELDQPAHAAAVADPLPLLTPQHRLAPLGLWAPPPPPAPWLGARQPAAGRLQALLPSAVAPVAAAMQLVPAQAHLQRGLRLVAPEQDVQRGWLTERLLWLQMLLFALAGGVQALHLPALPPQAAQAQLCCCLPDAALLVMVLVPDCFQAGRGHVAGLMHRLLAVEAVERLAHAGRRLPAGKELPAALAALPLRQQQALRPASRLVALQRLRQRVSQPGESGAQQAAAASAAPRHLLAAVNCC